MLGVPGPPRTLGLYRDGNRIAALPKPGALDVGYAAAALDALPYELIPHANVLLAGASGGFRVAERWPSAPRTCACWNPSLCWVGVAPRPGTVACLDRQSACDAVRRRAGRRGAQRRQLRCHRSVSRFPGHRRGQRDGLQHRRDRRLRRTPCHRAASSRSRSRFATSRPMHCACWPRCARGCWRPASPTRRHIPWSIVPRGAHASCCPTSRGTRRASPQ